MAAPVARAVGALLACDRADRPRRLLGLAVRGLPADRAAWGQAMQAELHNAAGTRARRRFSLGCVRAAAAIRIRAIVSARDRGAAGMRAALLGAVAAAVGLAIYGFVRYPDLRALANAWPAAAILVGTLAAYVVCALALLRGSTSHAARARRLGVRAGIATGVAWLVVLRPAGLKSWVVAALLIALACPAGVAAVTARATRNRGIATAAALWSGLVGGLLVFVTSIGAAYLADGRPYDPQLIRDFHHSGLHDLAAYAVNDSLYTGLGVLLVIPIVCLAFGSLASRAAPRRRSPDPGAHYCRELGDTKSVP